MTALYMVPSGIRVDPMYARLHWDNMTSGPIYRLEPPWEDVCMKTEIDWYFTDTDVVDTDSPSYEKGIWAIVLLHNDITNMMRETPKRLSDGTYLPYANAFAVEWSEVIAIPATENR